MAVAVVDQLEVVEVEEQHRYLAAAPGEGVREPIHEQHAIREAGEGVVEGLVLELLLQLPELPYCLLEPIVLERGARLVGERLEQLQVVAAEAARHPQPIGDEHRANDTRLPPQWRHHAVVHAALLEVGLELRWERTPQRERGVPVAYKGAQPI